MISHKIFRNYLIRLRVLWLMVLLLCGSNFICAGGEIPRGPFLRLEIGGHTGVVWKVRFSPDGKELYTAGDDKVVRVWDIETGNLKRTLRIPIGPGPEGKIFGLDISPDGQFVAVSGYDFPPDAPIRIIDSRTGNAVTTAIGHKNVCPDLAFSPDGRHLASSSADGTARLWYVSSDGKLNEFAVLEGHTAEVYAVRWFPSGDRLVTASYDNTLRLWEVKGGKWQSTVLEGHKDKIQALAVTQDGRFVISGSFDGSIRLWDGFTGRFLKEIANQGSDIFGLAISPDGKTLATTTGMNSKEKAVYLWSVSTGERIKIFSKHDNVVFDVAWSPTKPGLIASTGGDRHPIFLWDANTLQIYHCLQGGGKPIWAIATATGQVAWGQTKENYYEQSQKSCAPLEYIFDAMFIEPAGAFKVGNLFQRSITEYKGLKLDAPDWEQGKLEIYQGREKVIFKTSLPFDYIRCYSILNEPVLAVGCDFGLYIIDAKTGNKLRDCAGHEDIVWAVSPYDNGRILVSGGWDQTMRFWNPQTGELLLSFYYDESGEWVAWTPNGYYKCSPKGDKLIGWHLNNGIAGMPEFYPAAQFRDSLHRPDIVERVLIEGSVEKAIASANAVRSSKKPEYSIQKIDNILPPIVRFVEPVDGFISDKERILVNIRVDKGQSAQPIEKVTLIINGDTANAKARDISFVKKSEIKDENARGYEVALQAGKNILQAIASNATAQSVPAIVTVEYRPTAQVVGTPTTIEIPSRLYVLSIGVSKYANKDFNLDYAASDAKRVAQAIERCGKGLFREVQVRTLADEQATRASVLQNLEWLRKNATQYDISVLYVSGHGMRDNSLDYYFMPYDSNPESLLATAIMWNNFTKVISDTAGKKVFIVDTCHAGSATGGKEKTKSLYDNTDVIQALTSPDVGAIALMATKGRQIAKESPIWGGGVFTTAVIEGLAGNADLVPRDGIIWLKELDVFVTNRVKELTKGEQTPVTEIPSTVSDFPIGRL